MANTFFGLSIAKSGLYAYQAAITTTAHNASNVQTEGYTRQRTVRSASQAISVSSSYGMQGTGVDVTDIKQLRDEYYDTKYWNNSAILGNYDTKSDYLMVIQNYYSEVGKDGTTASLNSFFNSLTALQTTPSDGTKRTQVAQNGQSLAEYFQYLYNGMKSVQKDINEDIKNTAEQINTYAEQLASLNRQINTMEVRGQTANDLRDSRNLIIDKLSQLANVSVTERPVGDGVGVNQYIVTLDGVTLVDTYNYNKLEVLTSETKNTQNDVDGLYDLRWPNGQMFNATSPTLGGKLQALFELRDGNNNENFKGTVKSADAGAKTITLENPSETEISKLDLAATDGTITIGTKTFRYKNFSVTKDGAGKDVYTFQLDDNTNMTAAEAASLTGKSAKTSNAIDYKGIPYYTKRLNEFVRTLSKSFNDIHKTGTDLEHHQGVDFFTGTLAGDGSQLVFGDLGTDVIPNSLPTGTDGYANVSYYNMTAGNIKVNGEILGNPDMIACAKGVIEGVWHDGVTEAGVDDATTINKLMALAQDKTMFRQGTPEMFLETFTGELGIDGKAALNFTESQESVIDIITNQRLSISGVDSDEEGMDLVKFRNAYNLCSKVVSVMNEIYDKLINGTAV